MQLDSKGDRRGLSWQYESLEGIFPPPHLFSPQVCILSTCCIFLFLSCSLSLHLLAFVSPPLFLLCLSHSSPICLFLCLHVPLSGSLLFLLMFSFVPIFPLVSLSLSFSSVPVVLTSCPAVEGGRSRGRKGMLILPRQRRSAEGDIEK